MKLIPVCLLAAGWVVLNVPLTVHGLVTSHASPLQSKSWQLTGTSLSISSPCADHVEISTTGTSSGTISVTATSSRQAQIDALTLASDPAGTAAISASSCAEAPAYKPLALVITVPEGTKLTINEAGSTDYHLGDIAGDLTAQISGSGDLAAGAVKNLSLVLNGDGDARIASATGSITARLTSNGDFTLGQAQAPSTTLDMSGSGDVKIEAGSTGQLTAHMNGDGDLTAPDVATINVTDQGNGDIKLASVNGNMTALLNGSGDLTSGTVAGDASLTLNGSGDAAITHVGGKLSQSNHGSGDVKIGE
jgi:hypothetical protein